MVVVFSVSSAYWARPAVESCVASPVPIVHSGDVAEGKRGENQSLLKSMKHLSDQWHEETKRTRRRAEQYIHGRCRR